MLCAVRCVVRSEVLDELRDKQNYSGGSQVSITTISNRVPSDGEWLSAADWMNPVAEPAYSDTSNTLVAGFLVQNDVIWYQASVPTP